MAQLEVGQENGMLTKIGVEIDGIFCLPLPVQEGFIFYFCPLPCYLCSRAWSSCSSSATDYFILVPYWSLPAADSMQELPGFFLIKVKRFLMVFSAMRHRWSLCSNHWALFKQTVTGSCYFFDSLGQFIPFKLTPHQLVLGFSAVTKAASSDDDICKWNLACCELLDWKLLDIWIQC